MMLARILTLVPSFQKAPGFRHMMHVEWWDPLGIMHVENKLFITLECLKSLVPVGFNVLRVYRESGTVRPTRHHAC